MLPTACARVAMTWRCPRRRSTYCLGLAGGYDDVAFVGALAERDVFVLPGSAVELPGFFRISLTATEEMIERALPVFLDVA